MATTSRTLRDTRRMRAEVDATIDKATADLARMWTEAWAEIVDEWAAAIGELVAAGSWPTRAQVLRAKRAQKALAAAAEALNQLASQAGVRILRDVSALSAAAEEWTRRLVVASLPAGADLRWVRVESALDAIVRRTTSQVHSRQRPLSRSAEAAMKQALIRGVVVGDNPKAAADRMLGRVRQAFEGGRWRAQNIARTEMMDAYRAASQASRAANGDVVAGWRWHAELSSRTCPACLVKHGTEYPPAEPGPLGHASCRCTAVPVTKPWRDLGFDIPEPGSKPVSGREWFDRQPVKVQRQILGPERLAALRAGELDWDAMATLRSSPGWRDSWGTAPLS